MCKQVWYATLTALLLCVSAGTTQTLVPLDPAGVTDGHVYLGENVAGNLPDESANSNNGNLIGSPQVVAGLTGEALQFNGTSDGIHLPDSTIIGNTGNPHANRTVIAVFNCADVTKTTKQTIFEEGGNTRGLTFYVHDGLLYAGGWNKSDYTPQWNPGTWISAPIGSNEWHVVAMVIRNGGAGQEDDKFEMWLDGALVGTGPGAQLNAHGDDNGLGYTRQNSVFHDGNAANQGGADGHWFEGIIDELWILNEALAPDVLGTIRPVSPAAKSPSPGNDVADVLRDSDLAWQPGDYAVKHTVYLGTDFNDVNEASVDDPRGVLLSQEQDGTTFDPGRLALGQTYYWRVDEVNGPPDRTVFKGAVWDFTVEPKAIPVAPVAVSASSVHTADTAPEKVIDGSGLGATGLHNTDLPSMWLSAVGDLAGAWIAFEFDRPYRFDNVHVWNHNSQTEFLLGYSIREVTVATSDDGQTWTDLKTAELPQAPSSDSYAGADLSLDGVVARYVRLTAGSNYSLLGLQQVGLAEVRFDRIPNRVREPEPGDAAGTADVAVTLRWRAGREAGEHRVLFDTDEQAVRDGRVAAQATGQPSLDLGTLDLGTVYFWRVDEANDTVTPSLWPGDVWSFFTPDEIMIDDMESYQVKDGLFIWQHWVDGFDDPANNGAIVGNGDDPETGIVFAGSQSLPMTYDNAAAPRSEATRSFDPPLDLARGNPESIELRYRGLTYAFNGYYSADGTNWTAMAWNPQYVTMSEDALIGLAVTSHDVAQTVTADVASVSTTGTVTGDWTQADIGATAQPSQNFSLSGGVFSIPATGADIWGTADDFRYVYKSLSGEGSITARVNGFDALTNAWLKIGVMIRDAALPESSFAAVYATGSNGVRYQARLEEAVGAVSDTGVLDGTQELMIPPVWIRMERTLANDPAPLYLTLTDSTGKSATIETDDPAATQTTEWTRLGAAPADLNVNLSRIASLTLGVGGSNAAGKVFIDNLRTVTPYPAYDLVAQYPLDGDAQDVSGNGFHGSFVGEPNLIDGVQGQAFEFDGTGTEYIDLGTFNPSWATDDLSVSLWARWNGLSGFYQGLIGKRDTWNAAGMMWDIEAHRDTGVLRFGRNGSTVSTNDGVLPEGEWTHVAVTVDGSEVRIYLAGVERGSGSNFSFGTDTRAPVRIGAINPAAGNAFNGGLDEVRIYDRPLSPEEVQSLATLP